MPRLGTYSSTGSIIQSSGYGKSRMVNEMANRVFTLPFNLRDPEVTKGVVKSRFISSLLIMPLVGAYPDPDPQVTGLLTEKFSSDPPPSPEYYLEAQSQELATRYH